MFKSEGIIIFCMKIYVKVRIHTKMYDMPRMDVYQSTIATIYDNLRKYMNIYKNMFNYVRQSTTKNTSLRQRYLPHTKVLQNRGLSYEKLRITANNHDKLRKAKTTCEFPIRTLTYPKSRTWDRTLRSIIQP